MSECLYPTLVADGSLSTPAADNCSTLQKQITSELDKYLQEATEKRERYDNVMKKLTMQLHWSLTGKTPMCTTAVLLNARTNPRRS